MEDQKKTAKSDIEQLVFRTTRKGMLGEAGVMIAAALGIALLGPQSSVLPIFIMMLLGARFVLFYRRGDVVIFLLGVLLGGGNDMISMWRGVYYYTAPTLLPVSIPVWMVIFWGEAFLFFRRLMQYAPFQNPDVTATPCLDAPLLLDLLLLIPLRITVYRYAAVPWLPDAVFAAVLLVRYLVIPLAPHERRLLLTILVLGPLYEIGLVASGLYVYTHGVVFGLPLWLIIYWLYIIRLLKSIFDRIELRLIRVYF